MKVLIMVLSTLALASAVRVDHRWLLNQMKRAPHGMAQDNFTIVKGNFDAPLEHFSPTDNQWVTLNYSMNVDHFKEGGPLFIILETSYIYFALHRGLVRSLARELNGAMIISTNKYLISDIG